MRVERIGLVGALAGVMLGGLVAAAGCDGSDDAVSGDDQTQVQGDFRFHRRHRGQDAGSVGGSAGGTTGVVTGGTTGSGGAAGTSGATPGTGAPATDCDICTKAQQCCQALPAEPVCTFSAATCASEPGEARPAYVNACLTFVVSVRGAWGGNPPAECR
jgi:hypothetical protein